MPTDYEVVVKATKDGQGPPTLQQRQRAWERHLADVVAGRHQVHVETVLSDLRRRIDDEEGRRERQRKRASRGVPPAVLEMLRAEALETVRRELEAARSQHEDESRLRANAPERGEVPEVTATATAPVVQATREPAPAQEPVRAASAPVHGVALPGAASHPPGEGNTTPTESSGATAQDDRTRVLALYRTHGAAFRARAGELDRPAETTVRWADFGRWVVQNAADLPGVTPADVAAARRALDGTT